MPMITISAKIDAAHHHRDVVTEPIENRLVTERKRTIGLYGFGSIQVISAAMITAYK